MICESFSVRVRGLLYLIGYSKSKQLSGKYRMLDDSLTESSFVAYELAMQECRIGPFP